MSNAADRPAGISTAPLTPDRWADLEKVFGGGRGDCGRCWCMYWRLPRRDFEASLGDKARRLFRARVEAGPPPGLVAYRDGDPVGWVQVGPRADVPQWNGARRLTAPMRRRAGRRPAGVGHLLLRDQVGLPPPGHRHGPACGRDRVGARAGRRGARGVPGRHRRQPAGGSALSRCRLDVSRGRFFGGRAPAPRPAAAAPAARRLDPLDGAAALGPVLEGAEVAHVPIAEVLQCLAGQRRAAA